MTAPKRAARDRALRLLERLKAAHPDAHCELAHAGPFQLLVATVLSAQTTDVVVNQVTPTLFDRYPNPKALGAAELTDVEAVLSRLGMFRQKAKSIISLSQQLVAEHGGQVPHTLDALVRLPGVGRKTANVVLGVAFGAPEGVVVDTHVQRISQRLGLTLETQPGPIEHDLMSLFPRESWDILAHTIIFHGRRVCTARAPACSACVVADACPSAFRAEAVGRKTPRPRRLTAEDESGKTRTRSPRRPRSAPTTQPASPKDARRPKAPK